MSEPLFIILAVYGGINAMTTVIVLYVILTLNDHDRNSFFEWLHKKDRCIGGFVSQILFMSLLSIIIFVCYLIYKFFSWKPYESYLDFQKKRHEKKERKNNNG